MRSPCCETSSLHKEQRGQSLIELMVSITLGLMLVSSLVVMYANAHASAKTRDRRAEMQTNGSFAIRTLKTDLRAAGFSGFSWAPANTPSTTLPPIGNECLQAGAVATSFASNVGQAIWGSQDSNPFSANCIPSSHYARGDVLVVRSMSTAPSTTRLVNRLYLRSSYAASEVFAGGSGSPCPPPISSYAAPFNQAPCLQGTPGVDLLDFQIETHVYFIRSYTVSANESPRLPALCRLTLRSDGVMAEEVVASGVEDLRLQYARVLANGSTQYVEASAIEGTSSAATPTNWDDVNAVRIWLLAHSPGPEPGYANKTVYALGSSTFPRNPANASADVGVDAYPRQLFNTMVQLRNR